MHHRQRWLVHGHLVKEMATIYKAINQGQPITLPELLIQHPDFARRQRAVLQVLEEQLRY